MRPTLIQHLRCPACQAPLRWTEPYATQWIEHGELICTHCNQRYCIRKGIAYIYVDNDDWKRLATEASGWVQMAKDAGCYDQTHVDIDFRLPYVASEPWPEIAYQFDLILSIIRPKPHSRVLDLGAGRGWAAKQFAIRGCDVVAVEINDDDQIGVGRSLALMQQANVSYDILIANSQHLPLADQSYDIVFASAALHHSTSLEKVVREAARILRRGGKLVAIHEPCIADHITPEQDAPNIARETAYHIQELRPKLDDYRRALQQAGLRELAMFHHETYGVAVEKLQAWSKKNDLPPLTEQQMRDLQRNRRFSLHHIARTIQSRFKRRPDPALLPPQAWMDQFYRRCGGNLTLISERL